jgi:hypothetical protein
MNRSIDPPISKLTPEEAFERAMKAKLDRFGGK